MSEEKKPNILKLKTGTSAKSEKPKEIASKPVEIVEQKVEKKPAFEPKISEPIQKVEEKKQENYDSKPDKPEPVGFKATPTSSLRGIPQVIERTSYFDKKPRGQFGRPGFGNRSNFGGQREGGYKEGGRSFGNNFGHRDGQQDRPYPPRDGENRPNFVPREGGSRPFVQRDPNRPFVPREGGSRPFVQRDPNRPFVPREGGSRPFGSNFGGPREGGFNRPREGEPGAENQFDRGRFQKRTDGTDQRFNRFGPRPGFNPAGNGQNGGRFGDRPRFSRFGDRPASPDGGNREGGFRSRFNSGPGEGGVRRFSGPRPGGNGQPGQRFGQNFGGPRPFRPSLGGLRAEYTQENMPKKNTFDDKKKKRIVDKDDRVKDFKFKDDDLNINTMDFVGRVDDQHLENHAFLDTFSKKRSRESIKKNQQSSFIKREIEIAGPLSIKEIAAKMAMQVRDVLHIARKAGLNTNEKENIEPDILQIIVEECKHTPIRIDEQNKAQLEFPKQILNPETAVKRPPVVVVVGHVDHGKTSLLDYIRKTRVVQKEAGGITQSIGAYQVHLKGGDITFIDTPGHEAFTSMRARGVNVTDIAILVVSGEDSVKPQTIEAIAHIKSAKVPIIVAITKSDLHTANPDKVKQDLLSHEIVAIEYGGDTVCLPVSVHTGQNIDKLLDAILVQAEVLELKANKDVEARGIVLESKINPKIGTVATLLVQQGTLKKMNFCLASVSSGNIKGMTNDLGKPITEATPGTPVEVLGFDSPPPAGSEFGVISNAKLGTEILKARIEKHENLSKQAGISFSLDHFAKIEIPNISLILRADTQGSLEALKFAVQKLNNEKSETKIILSSIGAAKESDIDLAVISGATIVGFNTKTSLEIRKMAEQKGIQIIEDAIIYNLTDQIEAKLLGLIKPEEKEVFVGSAKIQQIFSSSKLGNIAGCMVINGSIKKGLIAKIIRKDKTIFASIIDNLKRGKDDVKEVNNGFECGILVKDFNDFQVGDEIHCYKIEYIQAKL